MFGAYLPIFVIALLFSVTARCVATFLYYDVESFHYTSNALINAANITVSAASLIMLTYMLAAKRDMRLIPDFTTPATYIPTGMAALTLLFFAKSFIDKAISAFGEVGGINRSFLLTSLVSAAVAVLSVLSIIHFVLTALDERSQSAERAKFGFSTVMLFAIYSIYLYFDSSMPINAPAKITDQVAYMLTAVFFLYETRLSIGREKWRAYISFGFIASLLTAYSSIPSIIIYIADGTVISNSIYESALTFALFIFITARLFLTSELTRDEISETAAALIGAAEARELELSHEEPEATDDGDAEDKGQITFDDIVSDLSESEDDNIEQVEDTEVEE